MNDASPWIDPELITAGKLLQEKGLVVPDRTVAPLSEVRAAQDRVGAFLGEGSVPLKEERDLSLPGPHGQVPCRLYKPDGVDQPAAARLCAWRRLHAGQHSELGPFSARSRAPERRRCAVGGLQIVAGSRSSRWRFDEMVAMTRLMAREGAGFGIDPLGWRSAATRPAPIWRSRRRWHCAKPASSRSVSSC